MKSSSKIRIFLYPLSFANFKTARCDNEQPTFPCVGYSIASNRSYSNSNLFISGNSIFNSIGNITCGTLTLNNDSIFNGLVTVNNILNTNRLISW